MKARSALFTLFGDVIRPAGGEAWLSTITACMATLGFRGPAVRTALHRMATEGWVEPRREGRYSAYELTEQGVDRLDDAAKRIYRLRSTDWDRRWRLLLSPDLGDSGVIAELEWIGYGRLQRGVWAHPHPHPKAAIALVTSAGAAATWITDAGVGNDRRLAATAWALDDLRDRHLSFLRDWAQVAVPTDPAAMFGMRLRLVHHWRAFLFLDPGLPAEVLPDDWPGFEAAATFAAVYESLRAGSWAFYLGTLDLVPDQRPGSAIVPATSPFSLGLAVMQQD